MNIKDLEREKQLTNECIKQHIVSREQFEKFNELLYNKGIVLTPPQNEPQPSNTFDYAQMTRQQRRAYERRLAKENKRKY